MEGSLQEGLKNLKRLKHFNLSYNRIGSSIPDFKEWDEFKDLETLELQENKISGLIPTGFTKLPSLLYINLSHN
jgi:Leucine-rich repeat (LRR) protein